MAGETIVIVPTPNGDREFKIGRPKTRIYVNLLKFVSGLMVAGYERAVQKMAAVLAAGGEMDDTMLVFYAIDQLEVRHIEELAALLLHFDDIQEGVEFVERAGFDLAWFTEALAANAENIDLESVVKNLRRTGAAFALPVPGG